MSELPKWLQVGAPVATVRSDHRTRAFPPNLTRVARIGKRDVVMENGERFNLSRLERREGGDWGWTVRLMPADSPVVADVQGRADHKAAVSAAKVACENFCYRKGQPADAILALAALTGVEDEIRALFNGVTR